MLGLRKATCVFNEPGTPASTNLRAHPDPPASTWTHPEAKTLRDMWEKLKHTSKRKLTQQFLTLRRLSYSPQKCASFSAQPCRIYWTSTQRRDARPRWPSTQELSKKNSIRFVHGILATSTRFMMSMTKTNADFLCTEEAMMSRILYVLKDIAGRCFPW